jgi:hypothetical protein
MDNGCSFVAKLYRLNISANESAMALFVTSSSISLAGDVIQNMTKALSGA